MKTSENLDCSVFLYSDWWNDNTPKYSVYFDDELIEAGEMPKQTAYEIKFQRDALFGPHKIRVCYENREASDNLYANGKSVRSNYIQVSNIRLNHFYAKAHLVSEGTLNWAQTYKKDNIALLDVKGEYSFNFNSPFAFFFLPKI